MQDHLRGWSRPRQPWLHPTTTPTTWLGPVVSSPDSGGHFDPSSGGQPPSAMPCAHHLRPILELTCRPLSPAAYIKAYLLENGVCIAKKKTKVARKSLDPLYNQVLLFPESPQGKVLQVRVVCMCTRVHLHPQYRGGGRCPGGGPALEEAER